MARFQQSLLAIVLLLGARPLCSAQQIGREDGVSLSLLPTCAQPCLTTALLGSACSATNLTCLCQDATLITQAESCVAGACSRIDMLVAANVTARVCNFPIRDESAGFNAASNAFIAVVACVVALRIFQRWLSGSGFFLDDYLIVFLFLLGIPSTIVNIYGLSANGLGKDVWTLSFAQITSFFKFLYANEIFYFTEVFLLKACILIFYLRIFPSSPIRRFILYTLAFNLVCLVVFDFITIFQCHPVSFYWTSWDGMHEGTCISINTLVWVNAAVSIALDFWILGLPLSQLRHLQLHWKRKLGVALMFGVGLFVTAVSILRLQFLVQFGNSNNPTWDQYSTCYWSTVEMGVAVICACMPSLRLLLVRVCPGFGGTSHGLSRTEAPINLSLGRRYPVRNQNRVTEPDPSKKILYSRGFQVEYCARERGDGSSTAELVGGDVEAGKQYDRRAPAVTSTFRL